MVYQYASLDAVFHSLADPTRRAMMARLAVGETTVSELARPFAMSLPAVGKHLTVLERARLVERRREGRVRRVRLNPSAIREAAAFLEPYRRLWEHQLDRLAQHLGESPLAPEQLPWPPPRHAALTSSKSNVTSRPRRNGSSRRGPRRRR